MIEIADSLLRFAIVDAIREHTDQNSVQSATANPNRQPALALVNRQSQSALDTRKIGNRKSAIINYDVTIFPMYQSKREWREARSPTLVIACADGRWRDHIEDFAANGLKTGPAYDLLMIPGGVEPLALADLIPKDFNFLRRRLDMLVRSHGIRRIVLIAHENCGWYRERKLGPATLDLKTRQLADLRRARTLIHDWFGEANIETYFARVDGNPPRATFESV